MSEAMNGAPETIWLQGAEEKCTKHANAFCTYCDEIYWCQDEINSGSDQKYIRADLAEARLREGLGELRNTASTHELVAKNGFEDTGWAELKGRWQAMSDVTRWIDSMLNEGQDSGEQCQHQWVDATNP